MPSLLNDEVCNNQGAQDEFEASLLPSDLALPQATVGTDEATVQCRVPDPSASPLSTAGQPRHLQVSHLNPLQASYLTVTND